MRRGASSVGTVEMLEALFSTPASSKSSAAISKSRPSSPISRTTGLRSSVAPGLRRATSRRSTRAPRSPERRARIPAHRREPRAHCTSRPCTRGARARHHDRDHARPRGADLRRSERLRGSGPPVLARRRGIEQSADRCRALPTTARLDTGCVPCYDSRSSRAGERSGHAESRPRAGRRRHSARIDRRAGKRSSRSRSGSARVFGRPDFARAFAEAWCEKRGLLPRCVATRGAFALRELRRPVPVRGHSQSGFLGGAARARGVDEGVPPRDSEHRPGSGGSYASKRGFRPG